VSYSIQTRGNRSLKGTVRALINPPGPRSCMCVCVSRPPDRARPGWSWALSSERCGLQLPGDPIYRVIARLC
jgi:hypothetical protein